MKFLQKILFAAMIALFVGNADSMVPAAVATIFDLPANTPGLQNQDQNQNVNGVLVPCKHVIVPGTPADNVFRTVVPGINRAARRNNALAAKGNMYFPTKGVQPATAEAARYSCANVDPYQLNSPITNWYVKMFGGPNAGVNILNGVHVVPGTINAGYEALAALHVVPAIQPAHPIINFKPNMNAASIITPVAAPAVSATNDFWQVFRTIAANPVGRVLLYRILIEIRRKNPVTNIGCNENITGMLPPASLFCRNNHRSIIITFNLDDGLEFSYGNSGKIKFDPNDNTSTSVRINGRMIEGEDDTADTIDNGLFHELLHWFHFLRHYTRFYSEDVEVCAPTEYRYISRCFYGDISELFTWGGIDDEEMRTILGTPNHGNLDEACLFHPDSLLHNSDILVYHDCYLPNDSKYYNGDDLSENAYRMSTRSPLYVGIVPPPDVTPAGGLKMRFGHREVINQNTIINRFKLAHLVAMKCCNGILSQGGAPINNWNLINGEAAN